MRKRNKPEAAKSKPSVADPTTDVKVRAVTPADWPTIEVLFGKNGACGGCWCMFWRLPKGGAFWQEQKGVRNRTCFYVAAAWRDQGVAAALLREAVALAKRGEAAAVEGYPVVSSSQGKIPAAFAWTGVPGLFAKAGFKKLKRAAGLRPIYRLDF